MGKERENLKNPVDDYKTVIGNFCRENFFPQTSHSEILGPAKKFSVPPNSAPGLCHCKEPKGATLSNWCCVSKLNSRSQIDPYTGGLYYIYKWVDKTVRKHHPSPIMMISPI